MRPRPRPFRRPHQENRIHETSTRWRTIAPRHQLPLWEARKGQRSLSVEFASVSRDDARGPQDLRRALHTGKTLPFRICWPEPLGNHQLHSDRACPGRESGRHALLVDWRDWWCCGHDPKVSWFVAWSQHLLLLRGAARALCGRRSAGASSGHASDDYHILFMNKRPQASRQTHNRHNGLRASRPLHRRATALPLAKTARPTLLTRCAGLLG